MWIRLVVVSLNVAVVYEALFSLNCLSLSQVLLITFKPQDEIRGCAKFLTFKLPVVDNSFFFPFPPLSSVCLLIHRIKSFALKKKNRHSDQWALQHW